MTKNTHFNKTKFTKTAADHIVFVLVWLFIFPIVVVSGIFTKLTERKDDAKTRITSVESKIPPKNTKRQSSELQYSYIDDEIVGV
jgi:hypothetical protein